MTRLKVCFPVNHLGYGGAERQLVDLVLGLDKERFDALVVTIAPGGALEQELCGQPGVTLLSVNQRGRYDASPAFKMAHLLRRHAVHVVQPFLTPATLFGLMGAMLARTPIRIVTERCGLRKDRRLGNKLYRFVEDRLSLWTDAVVANSEAGRRYALRRGIPQHKAQVIYNGLNVARLDADMAAVARVRQQLWTDGPGWVVGNLASLTPAKDQATLLRAAALLVPQMPDLRVALVGDGPMRHPLEAMARELGVSDRVVFFGSQRRVGDYLAAFDVAVLPSIDNEGCSNFLVEAMYLGKPVIATAVGGNRELVRPGETGMLIPPGDPHALAEAVARARMDAERWHAMAAHAREFVQANFSMAAMVASYERLYRRLAERKLGLGNPFRQAVPA